MNQLIAIEGIVHAGKTTLIRSLEEICDKPKFQFIQEYGYFVNGGQNFPGFPDTQEKALISNYFFRNIENARFETIIPTNQIVILDRSLISVLAYHYATEKITQGNIKCFDTSFHYFIDNFPEWIPQVCLYLKISTIELFRRHDNSGFYESTLLNEKFNQYILFFYNKLKYFFPNMKIYEVEAHKTKQEVLNCVLNRIKKIGFS